MADEKDTFETARVRLEEIAAQVKRKDISLERSLDLLEEGVRLANACTEQIDHAQWHAPEPETDVEASAHAEDHDAETGEHEAVAAAPDAVAELAASEPGETGGFDAVVVSEDQVIIEYEAAEPADGVEPEGAAEEDVEAPESE